MADKSSSHNDWDYDRLQEELRKQTELRDGLYKTTARLQEAVQESEKMLQNFPTEDMNMWKEHYLQQLSHNQQLEVQLKQLERKMEELRNQLKEGSQKAAAVQGYEGMSDVTMRRLLKTLEKEKAEMEWQLKDCEWRLDQEAAAVHKAEEEKKTILTELGHASLELERGRSKQKHGHLQTGEDSPDSTAT